MDCRQDQALRNDPQGSIRPPGNRESEGCPTRAHWASMCLGSSAVIVGEALVNTGSRPAFDDAGGVEGLEPGEGGVEEVGVVVEFLELPVQVFGVSTQTNSVRSFSAACSSVSWTSAGTPPVQVKGLAQARPGRCPGLARQCTLGAPDRSASHMGDRAEQHRCPAKSPCERRHSGCVFPNRRTPLSKRGGAEKFPMPRLHPHRLLCRIRSAVVLSGILTGAVTRLEAGENGSEAPVLLRSFKETASPAPPFSEGRFEPRRGETVAFLGGTNTFDQDRSGALEMRFHLAWPGRELKLRNLAWQGDVLGLQARPRHFYTVKGDAQPGSVADFRERTEPGIIFIEFGKMESLPGGGWSADAYRQLVERLRARTGRLVLVAPTPFFPVGPAGALAAGRNERLAAVGEDLRRIAAEENLLFVDLFTPLRQRLEPALSTNGIHLTAAGHEAVAGLIAAQLNFPLPTGSANEAAIEALRRAIECKNRFWQQYYRPTNWAFLFGDRQHVPASRDPVEREQRWFLREIRSLPALLAEADRTIHRHAREAAEVLK